MAQIERSIMAETTLAQEGGVPTNQNPPVSVSESQAIVPESQTTQTEQVLKANQPSLLQRTALEEAILNIPPKDS